MVRFSSSLRRAIPWPDSDLAVHTVSLAKDLSTFPSKRSSQAEAQWGTLPRHCHPSRASVCSVWPRGLFQQCPDSGRRRRSSLTRETRLLSPEALEGPSRNWRVAFRGAPAVCAGLKPGESAWGRAVHWDTGQSVAWAAPATAVGAWHMAPATLLSALPRGSQKAREEKLNHQPFWIIYWDHGHLIGIKLQMIFCMRFKKIFNGNRKPNL